MKVSLLVLSPGKLQNQTIPVRPQGFLIGRSTGCHLRATSHLVSRHHCLLGADADRAFVRDLGSRNGTQVNGQSVNGETMLGDGDQLQVGPLLFEVRVHAGVAVNEPTPAPPTRKAPGRSGQKKAPTPSATDEPAGRSA